MLTSMNFLLLIGYYCIVLSNLSAVVLSDTYPWENFQETCRPACESQECRAIEHDLLQSIRHTVDPCHDFYQHVCGNWKKYSNLEPYQGFVDLESTLQYEAYKKLRSKFEEPVKPHEDPEITQVKQLYYHCMKLPYLERVSEVVLREHMKKYGFWVHPSKVHPHIESWLTVHNHYLSISGDSPFFNIDLIMLEHDLVPHIRLQRTSSHYGALHHIYEWVEDQQHSYFAFLEKVVKIVAGKDESQFSAKTLENDLRDIFNFRRTLQKMSISQIDPSITTRLKINELSKWYLQGKSSPENGIGKINWLDVFRAFVQETLPITEETMINVHSKDYLHKLCDLLTHTRQRTVVNHIHLYFMERHIALNPPLKKLLFHSITEGLVSSGKIRYIPEQWYSCALNHNIGGGIGLLYTKSYVTEYMWEYTSELINYIKDVMMLQVRNTKWLSDSAKRITSERLRTIKFIIGYPNGRVPVMSENTLSKIKETSSKPTLFYSYKDNVLFISGMLFQPPVFDQNLPFAITYATLGSLVTHELYHMFDTEAVDNTGLHQIWGKKAMKHYKDNTQCFIAHYSKQKIKELEYRVPTKPKVDAILTRNENLADAMGLKTSYNAYKKMVWDRKGICPTLKSFKNLSCDKLFFISYARSFCSLIPEEMMVRRLHNSKYSPNRIRVNLPVSNMREFVRAFNCEVDAPMNLYKTCDLWD